MHSNRRKRFQLDDSIDQLAPLRSKPINVPQKSQNDVLSQPKLARSDNTKKRRVSTKASIFDSEHVNLRFADAPFETSHRIIPTTSASDGALPSNEPTEPEKQPRRLKIKKATDIDTREQFLDANQSIQLEDFDLPPNSTSTPLLGSPESNPENSLYWQFVEPRDHAWPETQYYAVPMGPTASLPRMVAGYPPGYGYVPISLSQDRSNLGLQESPLKQRGVMFYPHPSGMYSGPTAPEAYPWYMPPGMHHPAPNQPFRTQTYRTKTGRSPRGTPNTSVKSYRSSGGDATYRSSSH